MSCYLWAHARAPTSTQQYKEPAEGSSSRLWERKQGFQWLNLLKQAGANPFYSRNTKASHRKHIKPTLGKPCKLCSLSCLEITGEGRRQDTQTKPPAPELRTGTHEVKVLAVVTQQLASSALVQASLYPMLFLPYQCLLTGAWPRPLHPDPGHPAASQLASSGEYIFLWTQRTQLPKITPFNFRTSASSKAREKENVRCYEYFLSAALLMTIFKTNE